MYCCNQMGDKEAIKKYIQALEELVEEAFFEGFEEACNSFQSDDEAWKDSATLKQLKRIKKEVV